MDAKVAVMIAKADIARGSQADLALRHGLAIPARDLHQHARRKRFHPEHVTQRQLHRQWRHRTGLRTPQGRILPRLRLADLRELQSRPRRLHHALEHSKTPSKAQGPDPGRIPGSGPTGSRITATIKRVQVSGRSSLSAQGLLYTIIN